MGVDAGGDAFRMAQEVYGSGGEPIGMTNPAGSGDFAAWVGQATPEQVAEATAAGRAQEARSVPNVLSFMQRAEQQAHRYERTIALQAERLGIQGERITEAIRILANCKEPQCYAALRVLKGEV